MSTVKGWGSKSYSDDKIPLLAYKRYVLQSYKDVANWHENHIWVYFLSISCIIGPGNDDKGNLLLFFQICFIETIKSWIFYGKLVSNDNKVQTAHTCLFYNRTSLIEQFYCFIVILHSGYIVRHWIPNAIRDRSTCNAWNIKINKLHCTIVLQTKTGVNAVYKL